MCLAIPTKVRELRSHDTALVTLGGIEQEISLALVEDVEVGDYVIVHVGFALSRLDPQEAEETLAIMAEIAAAAGEGGEP